MGTARRYLSSCGLLFLPILAWNLAFTRLLPPPLRDDPWDAVPTALLVLEGAFRLPVFIIPFLVPLEVAERRQRWGVRVFAAGVLLYFLAWIPLIQAPTSAWSRSAFGFLAPAFLPAIWLLGIALLGRRLFWPTAYRWWMFLVPAGAFLGTHVAHVALVYLRVR